MRARSGISRRWFRGPCRGDAPVSRRPSRLPRLAVGRRRGCVPWCRSRHHQRSRPGAGPDGVTAHRVGAVAGTDQARRPESRRSARPCRRRPASRTGLRGQRRPADRRRCRRARAGPQSKCSVRGVADEAAQRWHDGEHGPGSAMARSTRRVCRDCGFYLPLAGSLGRCFGVCANELSADGEVVRVPIRMRRTFGHSSACRYRVTALRPLRRRRARYRPSPPTSLPRRT